MFANTHPTTIVTPLPLPQNPDFTPDSVGKVSGAARGLCLWVRAMETYGHVAKEVAPKKAKLKAAQVGRF